MGDYLQAYKSLYAMTLSLGIEYSNLSYDSKLDDYGQGILSVCSDGTVLDSSNQQITGKCWILQQFATQISGSFNAALIDVDDPGKSSDWFRLEEVKLVNLFKLFGFVYNKYRLNKPQGGICCDLYNNLYIADTMNHRILKVTSQGVVSVVVGTGQAGSTTISNGGSTPTSVALNTPLGIALSAYYLFICDTYNHRIVALSMSDNRLYLIAGSGTSGTGGNGNAYNTTFNYPSAISLGSRPDFSTLVYIADTLNSRIRIITLTTNGILSQLQIYNFAGTGANGFSGDGGSATNAQLNYPKGLAAVSTGLYISDTYNHRIRFVNYSTGNISTFAGTGTAGYYGDNGPAISGQLNTPYGITAASTGLYIADSGNNKIRFVNFGSLNFIYTFAGTGDAGFSGDGGSLTSARLNTPSAVALDSSSNFFIVDTSNNHIRKASEGILSTFL